jgi:hypothetical protein
MKNSIISDLQSLSAGLLYMSESDYPFDIKHIPVTDRVDIEKMILSEHAPGSVVTSLNTKDFFKKIISNFSAAGDEYSLSLSKRYDSLQNYITNNAH